MAHGSLSHEIEGRPPAGARAGGGGELLSRLTGAGVALVGGLVLVGWWLDLAPLKSVVPGFVTMKANTALAFLLAGASLSWLPSEAGGGSARRISQACATSAAAVGLLTLGEYLLGWDLRIDELLFRDLGGPGTSSPGRMAPTSAASFLLLGLALLFLDVETRRGGRPAQALTLVPMAISWLALIGYLYGVERLYGIASSTQMALPTALAFLALGAGVLLARPDRGWMATITSPSAGGALARRLLPASVVLPLVLGWGKLVGRRVGLYGTEFGLSLVVVLTASAFAVVVWRSARSLDRRDAMRKQAEAALAEREARFRGLLESAPDAIVIVDARGRIVLVNAQAERLFGYRRESLLDQPLDLLLPDRFRDRHAGHRAGYVSDPRPRAMGVGADLYARREDGSELPVEVLLSPLATEQGPLVISAIRDITERKRAELEMSRRRREAEVLAEVARTIVSARDLDVVLQGVGEAAADLCAADLSSVALREPTGDAMVFRHWPGARGLGIGDLRIQPGKGIGGQVLVTGRPCRTDNYAEDPGITRDYVDAALAEGVVATMAVPIWYGGLVEGLLYVQNRSARPFTDRDEAVLLRLAAHAAVAIENAYLFTQSERRRRAAETLLEVGHAVVEGLRPEEVAKRVVDSVRTALQGHGAVLYRVDRESGVLTGLAVSGHAGRVFGQNLTIPPGTGPIGLAAQELVSVVTSDALGDDRLRFDADARAALEQDPNRAVAAMPMIVQGQMIGVLAVVSRVGHVFSEDDVRLGQALADDAALALENARLYEDVKDARDFLQSIVDSSADAIVTTDAHGRITSWSPGASEIFGYQAEEALGRPVSEFYRRGPAEARAVMRRLSAEGRVRNYETAFLAATGRWVEVSTSVSLLRDAGGTIVGTLGIMKDVTEQKLAGESLAKLSSAVEHAGDAVFITDRAGVIEHVNPAFETLTGYTREEAVGRTPRILKSDTHPPGFYEDLWRRMLAGETIRRVFLNRKKDGSLFYEEKTIAPIRDGQDRITNFVSTGRDVTERMRAEERQAARFAVTRILAECVTLDEAASRLVTALGQGMRWEVGELWRPDPRPGLLRCEEWWHAPSFTDTEVESLRHHTMLETGHGLPGRVWLSRTPAWVPDIAGEPECVEEAPVAQAGLRTAFAFAIRLDSAVAGVFVFFSRESRPRDNALLEMAEEIGGQVGQFVARELAQKALSEREDQLRQSQKMEAVGTLAGGIAHDFNNLMTVISGRAQLLIRHALGNDRMRRDLGLIEQTAGRAARLVKQLLAFSRRQVLEPKVLDLNAVVEGTRPMLERLIREDVEVGAVLGPELWHVRVDPGQIEQVIVNLMVNARDAMPGGGRITVATANVELDEDARRRAGAEPGEYVMLAVSDTGRGMDTATQSRIFEPFFTTKAPGEGTGLGLATVYGIVKQSGGGIAVESAPGRGTTFRIYLPRVVAPLDAPGSASSSAEETLGGTETILLAEDDADLRALIREVLESRGYTVLEASDVTEALAIGGRHPAPIDLLLTDVVMPTLSGPELAQRLVSARPEMKVLYTSGYTGAVVDRAREPGPSFLEKPFTPAALALTVRRALDLGPGSS